MKNCPLKCVQAVVLSADALLNLAGGLGRALSDAAKRLGTETPVGSNELAEIYGSGRLHERFKDWFPGTATALDEWRLSIRQTFADPAHFGGEIGRIRWLFRHHSVLVLTPGSFLEIDTALSAHNLHGHRKISHRTKEQIHLTQRAFYDQALQKLQRKLGLVHNSRVSVVTRDPVLIEAIVGYNAANAAAHLDDQVELLPIGLFQTRKEHDRLMTAGALRTISSLNTPAYYVSGAMIGPGRVETCGCPTRDRPKGCLVTLKLAT